MIDPKQDPLRHLYAVLQELETLLAVEDIDSEEFLQQAKKASDVCAERMAALVIEEAMEKSS